MYKLRRLIFILFIIIVPLLFNMVFSSVIFNNPIDFIILNWLVGVIQIFITIMIGVILYYASYLIINIIRWVGGYDSILPSDFWDILNIVENWIKSFLSKKDVVEPYLSKNGNKIRKNPLPEPINDEDNFFPIDDI